MTLKEVYMYSSGDDYDPWGGDGDPWGDPSDTDEDADDSENGDTEGKWSLMYRYKYQYEYDVKDNITKRQLWCGATILGSMTPSQC